jgi:hypothetical protein
VTIIEINNKYYTIPTTWNELSQRQLLQVMDCLFIKQYPEDKGRLKLLKILCAMNWWQFFRAPVTSGKKRKGLFGKKIEVTGMDEYLYLADFLLKEEADITKQLFPVYDELYGPAENFSNLVMDEFVFSEQYFMQWSEDKNRIDALNDLIGCIYRTAKKKYDFLLNPDGDARKEFNDNVSKHFASTLIAAWPMKIKLAIATWYGSCRSALARNNPDVFGGGSGNPAQYGLVSVMMAVAKRGVLGDFKSVEKQYVTLVMMDLNESIAEAREMEKAHSK